jgi:hypothetical protein
MQIYENKPRKSSSPVPEPDMTLYSPESKTDSPETGYEDLEVRLSSPDADKFLYQLIKLFDYVSLHSASPDLWDLADDMQRLETVLSETHIDLQPLRIATETIRKLFTIMQTFSQLQTENLKPESSQTELQNHIMFLEKHIALLETNYNKFRQTSTSAQLQNLRQKLMKIEKSILHQSPYESILELVKNIHRLPDNQALIRRASSGLKALHEVIADFRNNNLSEEGQSA